MNYDYPLCNPVPNILYQPDPDTAYFNAPDRDGYNPHYKKPGDPVGHKGLDLHARLGKPANSPQFGTVRYAGWGNAGAGNVVVIIDPDVGGWWMSRLLHLYSWAVVPGEEVAPGQQIGTVGCTGQCNQPHVHYEIRWLTKPFNPNVDSYKQGTPLDPMKFGILDNKCSITNPGWPKLLKPGMDDPHVPILRAGLVITKHRKYAGPGDYFGIRLVKQVKRFQRDMNLDDDGIVGPLTRRALYNAIERTNR